MKQQAEAKEGHGLAVEFAEEEQADPHHMENPPVPVACWEGKPPAKAEVQLVIPRPCSEFKYCNHL